MTGNAVNSAEREAMADVAGQPFFRTQVAVVLRNRGFEHRRAKIRSIAQALGKRVVREQAEPECVAPAQIDVTGVVPALRGVREQLDGAPSGANRARWAARGRRARYRDAGRQSGVADEFQNL